ncbi:hypothetical protein NEMBOFW57_008190 [Staphylotrichum longicolle]|uniref:DUF7136 domain-containing protein n=1 Tax=Staphylotrichum longicolle TaxID=669026 RepID=A0AAD4EQT0_9PEZI|nr:hypothetical protein NEMBOFW57_008190 [Staphylotrichum longicolle]
MRIASHAVWSFVASLACMGAVVNATTPFEVALVYPRWGQTYAPTPAMPIVFAVRNAHLARRIFPVISFQIRNSSDTEYKRNGTYEWDLKSLNWTSSEPYFILGFVTDFAKEGDWTFWLKLSYQECSVGSDGTFHGAAEWDFRSTLISMTTRSDGRAPLDLVGATADEESCRGVIPAIDIDVGDEVRQVTFQREAIHDTCVEVPEDRSAGFYSQYCDLKIDSARAANISAFLTDWCAAQDPPIDCSAAFKPSAANSTTSASSATHSSTANPSTTAQSTTSPSTTDASKNAGQQLKVAGTASFMAMLGVFGWFLG